MLFNSLEFVIFFIIVYGLYLILKHHLKWQNLMLLVASYVFYGAWDWRFLSLILVSTVLDYFCGIKIYQSKNPRRIKLFLLFSIIGNLTILGFFKYFNFFAVSLQNLLNILGFNLNATFFNIILPVGISFYTFQTMSYTIDIYYGKLEPTKNFLDFALFVSFFPQLVAGPIERASHLLPQILSPRKITLQKFYEGCYLIFWGLFLKVFIADNLATIVDPIFGSEPPYNGIKVLLALYAFSFQILCDFAGYSSIARGLGKCMGFDIMVNFNLPYFSTNPREFWQRWHISLSTWLRDYLYIPLGGNRKGKFKTYRNLLITMLLGGLWHGAAWTFILWGVFHGIALTIYRGISPLLKKIPSPRYFLASKIWFFVRVFLFYNLVCFSWLLFRAQSISQVSQMLRALFTNFNAAGAADLGQILLQMVFILFIFVVIQIFQYLRKDQLFIFKTKTYIRSLFYLACFYLIIFYGVTGGHEFIYFQF